MAGPRRQEVSAQFAGDGLRPRVGSGVIDRAAHAGLDPGFPGLLPGDGDLGALAADRRLYLLATILEIYS
jgi:hypothetical protein